MRRFVSLLCLLLIIFVPFVLAAETEGADAVIATGHALATEAGLEILREGGNAIDAAIAVQMALNVVEPQASGIGGGCFLVYYSQARDEVIALDGREEAPAAAFPEMFLRADGQPVPFYPDRITGGRAAGVPGCLAALEKAWRLYGSGAIPWARLFDRAIALAEQGFPVSPALSREIDQEKERLARFSSSRAVFLRANRAALEPGATLIQKDLAATFRLIAEQGVKAFYEGEIARDIVKAVRGDTVNAGFMTLEDLKSYQAPLRRPITGDYRGYQIFGMPSPSSGGMTVAETLNILESYQVYGLDRRGFLFIHLFSEAQRLAFQDRNRHAADADFADMPVEKLISKQWAAERRGHASKLARFVGGGRAADEKENESTSHISIMDGFGNALAMTTTIEHVFGSALVVPGRGFVLNNELTDFSATPVLEDAGGMPHPNRPEGGRKPRRTSLDMPQSLGGKRPLSSMSPTLIFRDGKPLAAVGSPGGTQIIGTVLNVIVNVLDFGMTAEEATAEPRIIQRAKGLEIESALLEDGAVQSFFANQGAEVKSREPLGDLQLVMRRGDRLEGASDPRGEGKAVSMVTQSKARD